MDVLVLIDKLDDLVHNAKPVPLTDQVRVDKGKSTTSSTDAGHDPRGVKQARWIVRSVRVLAEAKREASGSSGGA
jgi:hypothetical protein